MHLEWIPIGTNPLSGDPFSQGIPNHLFERLLNLRQKNPKWLGTFSGSNSKVGVLKLFFFLFGGEFRPSFWEKSSMSFLNWRNVTKLAKINDWDGMIHDHSTHSRVLVGEVCLEPTEERIIPKDHRFVPPDFRPVPVSENFRKMWPVTFPSFNLPVSSRPSQVSGPFGILENSHQVIQCDHLSPHLEVT